MTEQELIERLAMAEHDGWARYMAYFLDKCEVLSNGDLRIEAGYVSALRRQAKLNYHELTAQEQQYDRDEVAHIMPYIREFAGIANQEVTP